MENWMNKPARPRIAVLALGLMGSAVAKRLVDTGWQPTVWNRTPGKVDLLTAAGAQAAPTAEAAWRNADIIFMVPISYEAGFDILGGRDAAADFGGKTFVQLANGGAADAREFGHWMTRRGAKYLDANIFSYPDAVGDPNSLVVYCGAEQTFRDAKPVFDSLSDRVVHASENPATGNAITMAMSTFVYGALAAFFQASLMCEAEGENLGALFSIIQGSQPETDGIFQAVVKVAQTNPPLTPAIRASLWTHLNALESAFKSTEGKGFDTRIITQTLEVFQRLAADGYGDSDIEFAYLGMRPSPARTPIRRGT
jgi:3-hydroxyisobutyrate dehydrogenase-like beta-hydroxyacid dehydrogenase